MELSRLLLGLLLVVDIAHGAAGDESGGPRPIDKSSAGKQILQRTNRVVERRIQPLALVGTCLG